MTWSERVHRSVALLLPISPLGGSSPSFVESAVNAGEKEEQLKHQNHRGHNQTEHVARRSVPFIISGEKEFILAINIAVYCAYGYISA